MVRVELVPYHEHCIQTVARRKYAELALILLGSGPGDDDTGEKLEILRLFLEKADFNKLRCESEKHFAGGKNVRFTVYLEANVPECEMHVT